METLFGIILIVAILLVAVFFGLTFYAFYLEIKDRKLEIKEKEKRLNK